MQPAHEIHRERLPKSTEEAKWKLEHGQKRGAHIGLSAQYDIYNGDASKWKKLDDPRYSSNDRMAYLYKCLRKANMHKRN